MAAFVFGSGTALSLADDPAPAAVTSAGTPPNPTRNPAVCRVSLPCIRYWFICSDTAQSRSAASGSSA